MFLGEIELLLSQGDKRDMIKRLRVGGIKIQYFQISAESLIDIVAQIVRVGEPLLNVKRLNFVGKFADPQQFLELDDRLVDLVQFHIKTGQPIMGRRVARTVFQHLPVLDNRFLQHSLFFEQLGSPYGIEFWPYIDQIIRDRPEPAENDDDEGKSIFQIALFALLSGDFTMAASR